MPRPARGSPKRRRPDSTIELRACSGGATGDAQACGEGVGTGLLSVGSAVGLTRGAAWLADASLGLGSVDELANVAAAGAKVTGAGDAITALPFSDVTTAEDPGAGPGEFGDPAAATISPELKAKVDALKPPEKIFNERGNWAGYDRNSIDSFTLPQRGGKNGLLAYMGTKRVEYGIFRRPNGDLYVVRGGDDEVWPLEFHDALVVHTMVAHNHPSNIYTLSKADRRGFADSERKSTIIATQYGTYRNFIPRTEAEEKAHAGDAVILGGTGPRGGMTKIGDTLVPNDIADMVRERIQGGP